ncbi:MAG: response regulator [Pseudobdellovibrionaceae bacterium]
MSTDKKMPQGGMEADRAWQVLLVEDDQDDAMMASRILEQAERIGDVRLFRDASHLFHYLSRHHLADGNVPTSSGQVVILLDIHLPGMDGMVVLEQLKTSPLTESIPIVILTGDQDLNKIYDAYRNHANAFIQKPLRADNLRDLYAVFDKGSNWKDAF